MPERVTIAPLLNVIDPLPEMVPVEVKLLPPALMIFDPVRPIFLAVEMALVVINDPVEKLRAPAFPRRESEEMLNDPFVIVVDPV